LLFALLCTSCELLALLALLCTSICTSICTYVQQPVASTQSRPPALVYPLLFLHALSSNTASLIIL
jgi:hypothetical protein